MAIKINKTIENILFKYIIIFFNQFINKYYEIIIIIIKLIMINHCVY